MNCNYIRIILHITVLGMVFVSNTLYSKDILYPISPFVVGPKGKANYQDIQSALDDANNTGGGIVVIQPGIYYENLTLYDKTQVVGAIGLGDFGEFVIEGTHTPPLKGSFSFRNVFLKHTKNIFFSKEAGTSDLMLIDVAVGIKDGYTFDLPKWKGSLGGFDIGIINAENDGWINNLAGCVVFMTNVTIGAGSKYQMNLSGNTFIFGAAINCPITFLGNTKGTIAGGTICHDTISLQNNASINMIGSSIETKENPAIIYNSSNKSSFSGINVSSSSTPSIIGSGSGLVVLNGIMFENSPLVEKSLNIGGGSFVSGNIMAITPGKGLSIAEGKNAKMGVAKLFNGRVFVKNSSITNKSRIFLTIQSGNFNSGHIKVSKIQSERGFEIESSESNDESNVAWLIIEGIE